MLQAILKNLERRPAAPRKSPPSNKVELDGNSLFEALMCELHWTALQIGGVTQLFNAAAQKNQSWKLRGCRNLLPVQSAVVGIALKSCADIALRQNIAQAITSLYLNVADARLHTEKLIDQTEPFKPSIQIDLKIQHLTAVWRLIAADFHNAVVELEPEIRWRLPHEYSQNTLVLSKVLKEASKGGADLVDAMGSTSLPVLPQRRREPRFVMLQPCVVSKRNGMIRGMARDISRSGMGIACTGAFTLRETVVVEIRNSRRFAGRIVWNRDGKQGIQFEEPLSYTDPLFAV